MALYGIDVSSYQSELNVADVAIDFIIIKATEGAGYVNPACDTHYQEAKVKGVLRGVYHFAANLANSPQEEAAYFVKNIKGYIGDGLLALDYENSAYNDQNNVGWAFAWLEEVKRLTGVKPLLYANASCINSNNWSVVINAGYALWVAAYQGTPPDVNWPNNDQAAWQFTSSAHIAGYSGNLDRDEFWGDANGWHRYAAAVAAPAPEPAPATTTTTVAPVTTTTTTVSTTTTTATTYTPPPTPPIPPLPPVPQLSFWQWLVALIKSIFKP